MYIYIPKWIRRISIYVVQLLSRASKCNRLRECNFLVCVLIYILCGILLDCWKTLDIPAGKFIDSNNVRFNFFMILNLRRFKRAVHCKHNNTRDAPFIKCWRTNCYIVFFIIRASCWWMKKKWTSKATLYYIGIEYYNYIMIKVHCVHIVVLLVDNLSRSRVMIENCTFYIELAVFAVNYFYFFLVKNFSTC